MGASLTCFCLPLVCTYGRAPFFPPTLAYSWYGFALVGISIGYGCSRFRVVNGLEWRMRIQHAYIYGIQKQNIRLENQTVIEKEIWKVHKAEGEKGFRILKYTRNNTRDTWLQGTQSADNVEGAQGGDSWLTTMSYLPSWGTSPSLSSSDMVTVCELGTILQLSSSQLWSHKASMRLSWSSAFVGLEWLRLLA